jgi:hypothetical protein
LSSTERHEQDWDGRTEAEHAPGELISDAGWVWDVPGPNEANNQRDEETELKHEV